MDPKFPYIKSIKIKDAFPSSARDYLVNLDLEHSQMHLILTGKNGVGKTTLLTYLFSQLVGIATAMNGSTFDSVAMSVELCSKSDNRFKFNNSIRAYFEASRKLEYVIVDGPKTGFELSANYSTRELSKILSQILVNQKVAQAFSRIRNDEKSQTNISQFFDDIEKAIQLFTKDEQATLQFDDRRFTYSVRNSNGHLTLLQDLPHGFSSLLGLLIDLFIRVYGLRNEANDFNLNPPGIVLIDEPELHLHIELQYEILPLLTSFFPNIQFIVATHSPAVASSLRNAVVFDLSTKKYAPSNAAGMSFTELMEVHFGVENEFGPEADELLKKYKEVYLNGGGPKEKREKITKLMEDYEDILTPVLRLEMESIVIRLESEIASI